MKSYVLDPVQEEVVDEKYFTWEITNYRQLPLRVYSPEFECGGFKWYIHVPKLSRGLWY